jgi:8-oxo-dGTP diphosphatase
MKTIEVVAAIIERDNKILATQRGNGEFKGMWEFPGGKIEIDEIREDALIREIQEELKSEISIVKYFHTIEYDYPNFHLTMHCFICNFINDVLTLVEHDDYRWLSKSELYSVDWLPADIEVLDLLANYLSD